MGVGNFSMTDRNFHIRDGIVTEGDFAGYDLDLGSDLVIQR